MLTLLKDIECYSPAYKGRKDIIIANDKIYKVFSAGCSVLDENKLISKVISCEGLIALPGIIDQHVHILGGGGETGFKSRIPEINIKDIIKAGVTTLVGVLGFDSYTKCLTNLLAKAKALQEEGITTYIYTGSYAVPTVTLTNSITSDLILIDKVIGVGEIAISDNRSTQPTLIELMKLAKETYIGSLLSGKAGIIHIHVGDDTSALQPLLDTIKITELPIDKFVPTHINRNYKLFEQGINFLKKGGKIDLTAGETIGLSVPRAIKQLINSNVNLNNITVSSDANGSFPNNKVSKVQTLYEDIVKCILEEGIPPDIAFKFVTENVAKTLNLYPNKGALKEGSDADILIIDKNYRIQKVICMGKILIDNGESI